MATGNNDLDDYLKSTVFSMPHNTLISFLSAQALNGLMKQQHAYMVS